MMMNFGSKSKALIIAVLVSALAIGPTFFIAHTVNASTSTPPPGKNYNDGVIVGKAGIGPRRVIDQSQPACVIDRVVDRLVLAVRSAGDRSVGVVRPGFGGGIRERLAGELIPRRV